MKWFSILNKKPTVGVESPQVANYPHGQYRAYWEIMDSAVEGGFVSEVRFHNYNGDVPVADVYPVVGPTKEYVSSKVNVLITDKMSEYKR